MDYIYFTITLIIFSMAMLCLWLTITKDGEFFFGFTFFGVVAFAMFATPYLSHISDLADIETAEGYIKVQIEYKNNLNAELNKLPDIDTALMNGDTPAKSLILAIADAEKEITKEKRRLLNAKKSIIKRKRGVGGYVFWFID